MAAVDQPEVDFLQPVRPDGRPVEGRQELMETACLGGLAVLGGLLFLALLLAVVELLYFGLTGQNGLFVVPPSGAS